MEGKTLRPAGFFPRAAAYLLDRLILGVLLFIPRLVLLFRSFRWLPMGQPALFRFTWTDILIWTLGAVYFVLFTALAGATPGKKAMGLTVVSLTGGAPDWMTVICRETFGRYLSSLLCIGYILCLADPDRGALHDRICDTLVVYADRKPAVPTRRAPPPKASANRFPAFRGT